MGLLDLSSRGAASPAGAPARSSASACLRRAAAARGRRSASAAARRRPGRFAAAASAPAGGSPSRRARAAVAYDARARARPRLEGAGPPPPRRGRGSRRRRGAAAPDVEALVVVPPTASGGAARPPPGRARSRASSAARWELPVRAAPRPRERRSPAARARRSPSAAATSRGAFRATASPPRRRARRRRLHDRRDGDAAASALRRAGARRVEVVTFARAVRGYTVTAPGLTGPRGGRDATSGEGQEHRGHATRSAATRSRSSGSSTSSSHDATQVELELAVEKNPSIAANHVAEATVWTKGPTLRAREASPDMKASIDQLVGQARAPGQALPREAERPRRAATTFPSTRSPPRRRPTRTEPQIVKTKQFPVKPMSPEEAVLQLELIGHDFFVFRNAETDEVNVVYRRSDGGYGLIEPRDVSFRRREEPLHERLAEQGGMTIVDGGHARRRAVERGRHPRRPAAARVGRRRHRRGRPPGRRASTSSRSRTNGGRRRGRPGRPARAARRRARDAARPAVPRRGHAARRRLWAVGASRSPSSRSPRTSAATRSSSLFGREPDALVDGAHGFGSVPALEALGGGMPSYVVRADRIDGDLWEVVVLRSSAAGRSREPLPLARMARARILREGPPPRRGPPAQAAAEQAAYVATLEPEFEALSDAELRRQDGRVQAAAGERRVARGPALRGVRGRQRGVQAHDRAFASSTSS